MDDWESHDKFYCSENSTSDEELEFELYSVLHYNSLSKDLPPSVLEKYNIKRTNKNEFLISLKNTNNTLKEDSDSGITAIENSKSANIISSEIAPEVTAVENTSKVSVELSHELMPIIFTTPPDSNVESNSMNEEVKHYSKCSPLHPAFSTNIETKKSQTPPSDVILISDSESDSGNDSDVVIQEPVHDVLDLLSSSSSVECLSDSDSGGNLIINTVRKNMTCTFPPAEGVEEVIKIKWREVDSPRSWSESMKRYYNKASRRLKYFDCDKIRQEIKGQGTWEINSDDLFPRRFGPVKRCSFCRQVDHLIKDCPKRFSNCYICGLPGHGATTCPSRMCLNCGEKSGVFVALCRKCESEKRKVCDECQQVGHVRSNCPDTWRRYHSTISGELKAKTVVLNENLMCCNCGKKGHLYEECSGLYWSSYPPTSFLVKNSEELEHVSGKRKSANEVPDYHERKNKKRRWSDSNTKFDRSRYFNQSPMGSSPNTPNRRKKKKKKSKSPHFKKHRNLNFNHTF